MPSGNDARFLAIKETTYNTRVTPTRSFEVTDDNLAYEFTPYASVSLGGGPWRRRVITNNTEGGSGTLPMEALTSGMGFWFDLLHPNTVTPAQQAATAAYKQTHSLSGAPSKSITLQKQMPPVSTSTLLPIDFTGVTMTGAEFAIDIGGVLMFTPTFIANDVDTSQSLATWSAPTSNGLYSFKSGGITIGGVQVADIVGGATASVTWPMRDDARGLGGGGNIRKPVPTDRPSFTGSFTADFENLTHLNRTVNGTVADVVLSFRGSATPIASTYYEDLVITIPSCTFQVPVPTVSGAGPVQQEVTFENASSTAQVPTIEYTSTDITV